MVATNDPILLIFLILGAIGFIYSINIKLKIIMSGTFLSLLLASTANGSVGAGFRFQMPLVIVGGFLAADYLQNFKIEVKSKN